MALSPVQNSMIQLLMTCDLMESQIIGVMLTLQEDEQLEKLAMWIDENPNACPSDILRKAVDMNPD